MVHALRSHKTEDAEWSPDRNQKADSAERLHPSAGRDYAEESEDAEQNEMDKGYRNRDHEMWTGPHEESKENYHLDGNEHVRHEGAEAGKLEKSEMYDESNDPMDTNDGEPLIGNASRLSRLKTIKKMRGVKA